MRLRPLFAISVGAANIILAAPPAAIGAQETTAPFATLLTIDPSPGAPRNSEGDIIELSDGRLAVVYSRFGGGAADHSAANLAMRTSADAGKTWSSDRILLPNEGGRNVMSVSLRYSQDNGILLFYLRKDTSATSCAMYVRRSYDDLQTLSDPVQVTTLPGYHVVNNDRVLRLDSGRLLVPSALHTDPATTASADAKFSPRGALVCYFSDDDGRSWKKDKSPVPPLGARSVTFQEPGAVQLSDGRIMMYIRTDRGSHWAAYSADNGVTWTSPAPTPLASPLSPATIERLPTSTTLIAFWNDHSGRWPYHDGNRTPLCFSTSNDDGASWSPSRMVESDPGGWFCYTSVTFEKSDLILSYCAGQGRAHGLNRLKVIRMPLRELNGPK